jgi:hypothetical protein
MHYSRKKKREISSQATQASRTIDQEGINVTKGASLRIVFDAVMRARQASSEYTERAWSVVKTSDAELFAWFDAFYRAEWVSIQAGWRPRTPASASEAQRWMDADRVIQSRPRS